MGKPLTFAFRVFCLAFLLCLSCAKEDEPGWVVRVKNVTMSPSEFMERLRESSFVRQRAFISVDDLIKFADLSIRDDLCFAAEGYALGIDKETEVQRTIHQRQIEIIGKPGGPLFRQVVPADLQVTEQQLRDLYERQKQGIGMTFDEAKENLRAKIKSDLEAKLVGEYAKGLYAKFDFRINPAGAALLVRLTSAEKKTAAEMLANEKSAEHPKNVPLVSFARSAYTVWDVLGKFPRYFAAKPKQFASAVEAEQFLQTEFLPELLFLDAQERGIINLPEVQEAFAKSARRIIGAECEKRLTVRGIRVTAQEVEERYQKDSAKYASTPPAKAKYDVRLILHGEKRRAKSKQVREMLRKKYKLEYNNPVLAALTENLKKEKNSE